MTDSGHPTALLFDLGNVAIDIDFDRAFVSWSNHSGVSVDLLRQRFRQEDAYARHERGEIDFATYAGHLRHLLGVEIGDDDLKSGWNAIYVRERPGMRDLLRRCAARLPTLAFTNTNATHQRVWSSLYPELLSHFSQIYVSSDLGLRKPDTIAYDAVIQAMGCRADQVLFFDDMQQNIDGARAAGLRAVLVNCLEDVTGAVAPILEESA
ncbi:MAG: HAD-IA family hydrolase [Gemmatimonadetes bacterium]|jgi:glucose-1-phosphatase|nr:HAD-IA family hydrolase [Gemmatimonadota bacterium]MBT6147409.1 HAD-IA family hydrolase [Gemmatimonadota bacterium]MBT7859294.1 HAD-IA family hydrolase [Gemmatimonadota bacterium]